jgi:pyridinium-3,5-biscarboxylic acid mononucleotide sulfurtransferase
MRGSVETKIARIEAVLDELGKVAVAVSGGVDSTTLAFIAHRRLGKDAVMIHATSPAVPPEGTARVRALAAREGWALRVIDAGEFSNDDYLSNPVNRCFFCKTCLYDAVARVTKWRTVSGANVDDLDDYRPGMEAAADHAVRHPFVEAGIDKDAIRAIADHFGLGYLAALPASPCLSSRIETGIPVTPTAVTLVHSVETLISRWLAERDVVPLTVRCRVRSHGIVVELDKASMTALDGAPHVQDAVSRLARQGGYDTPVLFEPYQRGSAFLHGDAQTGADA